VNADDARTVRGRFGPWARLCDLGIDHAGLGGGATRMCLTVRLEPFASEPRALVYPQLGWRGELGFEREMTTRRHLLEEGCLTIAPTLEVHTGGLPYAVVEHVPGVRLDELMDRAREQGGAVPAPIISAIGVALFRTLGTVRRVVDGRWLGLGYSYTGTRATHVVLFHPWRVVVGWDGVVVVTGLYERTPNALRPSGAWRAASQRALRYLSWEEQGGEGDGASSLVFQICAILFELCCGEPLRLEDEEMVMRERGAYYAARMGVLDEHAPVFSDLLKFGLAFDGVARLSVPDRFVEEAPAAADEEAMGAFVRALFPEEHAAQTSALEELGLAMSAEDLIWPDPSARSSTTGARVNLAAGAAGGRRRSLLGRLFRR
jgi:hypothetical protein